MGNGAPVDVTSLDDGTGIGIRCCPLKPFQGHNVFGTDNVIGLGHRLIVHVLNGLGVVASPNQLKEWKAGKFEINELHITYRHQLESHAQVGHVLQHLMRAMPLRYRPAALERGIGFRVHNPDTGAVFIMYDKRREFDDKRTREQRYLQAVAAGQFAEVSALIRGEANANIRSEVKLDRRYLQKYGLDTGSSWSKELVRSTYLRELEELALGQLKSIDEAEMLMLKIDDPKVRTTFHQWIHGQNIQNFMCHQTFLRRKVAIRNAIGIDISKTHAPDSTARVNIAKLFSEERIMPNYPSWTKKYPEVAYRGKLLIQAT